MATFTFLEPSGSNLIGPTVLGSDHRTTLRPTRNSDAWIYCNYPEQLYRDGKNKALAEDGYYLNQQVINGDAQIFYSYQNFTSGAIKFRIQIFNGNSSVATVKRTNCGFTQGWGKAAKAVEEYFKSSSQTITVPVNGTKWLTDEYVISTAGGNPFSGMIHIVSDKNVVITAYAYKNVSSIDGYATAYPYKSANTNDLKVYSGLGSGYFLTFNHGTIKVSALKNQSYQFATNAAGHLLNPGELTPIKLVEGGATASVDSSNANLTNLGNWGTQNYHKFTLVNDTSQAATVYGYIGSNLYGNTQVINRGGVVKGVVMAPEENGISAWKWCKITLSAGETYSFDFQQVLASYGAAATLHEWKV